MRLDVVTPKGPLLQVEADEVTAPGVLGEFGVLPGHVPFLTGIRPGVLGYRRGTESGALAVGPGYAEIANDRIVVLTDVGQLAGEIDVEAARRELAETQQKLDRHDPDAGVRAELEVQRLWAQARLDAAAARGRSAH